MQVLNVSNVGLCIDTRKLKKVRDIFEAYIDNLCVKYAANVATVKRRRPLSSLSVDRQL